MVFEIQGVQMNLDQASSLSESIEIYFLVDVLLCLYFGSNTVCSEVLHLSFIGYFIAINFIFFSFFYLPGISSYYVYVCRHFALSILHLFYRFGFEFILILDSENSVDTA